jgi:predicted DNA-binding mobile mystery protein A
MAKATARTARRELDRRFDAISRALFAVPRGGWVRAIRQALGLTAVDLAARMQISEGAVRSLERAEPGGTVSLERLGRAAEAMDCELVYAFLPRTSLAQTVERQARMKARNELMAVERTMSLEAQDADLQHDSFDETWQSLVDTAQLWR